MSGPPTAKVVGRGPTERLVVSFHEDPNSDATTRETVLRVGDELPLRGNPIQGSSLWSEPRRSTIGALFRNSCVRFNVPGYPWPGVVAVPLSEFSRWAVLDTSPLPAEPVSGWPPTKRISVYDWLRKRDSLNTTSNDS